MPSNTTKLSKLLTQVKFIGRISTMGERKMVIYIPLEHHQNISKHFKGKDLKVTLEEAL
jgi:hypothetical protein